MKYSPSQVILNDRAFQALLPSLVVVDGGARGELFYPFSLVHSGLEIYAFEPDSAGITKRDEKGNTTHFINKGLWKDESEVELHVARNPRTSSIYPPNMEFLADFAPHLGTEGRATREKVKVQTTSIDRAVKDGKCRPPHFIKLDIHSAEYEALEGAFESLNSSAVGVMVEDWHYPIHKGQKLHAHVETLLNDHNFFVFEFKPNSCWSYVRKEKDSMVDARRLVGSESVYLRDLQNEKTVPRETALAAVGVADLFGFSRFALRLLDDFQNKGTLDSGAVATLSRLLRRSNSNLPAFWTRRFWADYVYNLARAVLARDQVR